MKKILFAFIFFSLSLTLHAQFTLEKIVERDLNDGYDDEKVELFGMDGLILFSKGPAGYEGGKRKWKFEIYDTSLNLKEEKGLLLQKDLERVATCKSSGKLYALFSNGKGNFTIAIVDPKSVDVESIEGIYTGKLKFLKFVLLGEFMFVAAESKKEISVLKINCKSGVSETFTIPNATAFTLSTIEAFDEISRLMVYAEMPGKPKGSNKYALTFTIDGIKETEYKLPTDSIAIPTLRASPTADGFLFLGCYQFSDPRVPGGLISFVGRHNKIENIKLHPFTNIHGHQSGPKRLHNGNAILQQKIITLSDGYLFVGEEVTSDVTLGLYVWTDHVFFGKYDSNGSLLWANSTTLTAYHNSQKYTRQGWDAVKRDMVTVIDSSQKLILLCPKHNTIGIESFDSKTGQDLQKKEVGDWLKFSMTDNSPFDDIELRHWFKNSHIIFGEIHLKRIGNNKRLVLVKVSY